LVEHLLYDISSIRLTVIKIEKGPIRSLYAIHMSSDWMILDYVCEISNSKVSGRQQKQIEDIKEIIGSRKQKDRRCNNPKKNGKKMANKTLHIKLNIEKCQPH